MAGLCISLPHSNFSCEQLVTWYHELLTAFAVLQHLFCHSFSTITCIFISNISLFSWSYCCSIHILIISSLSACSENYRIIWLCFLFEVFMLVCFQVIMCLCYKFFCQYLCLWLLMSKIIYAVGCKTLLTYLILSYLFIIWSLVHVVTSRRVKSCFCADSSSSDDSAEPLSLGDQFDLTSFHSINTTSSARDEIDSSGKTGGKWNLFL